MELVQKCIPTDCPYNPVYSVEAVPTVNCSSEPSTVEGESRQDKRISVGDPEHRCESTKVHEICRGVGKPKSAI